MAEALELCQRELGTRDSELSHGGDLLEESTVDIDEVRRLMTVPDSGGFSPPRSTPGWET